VQAVKGAKLTFTWVVGFLSLSTGTALIAIRQLYYFAIDASAGNDFGPIDRYWGMLVFGGTF
jgi:hypothetical protein